LPPAFDGETLEERLLMVDKSKDRTLAELQDNQEELRKNIEASKELIARSDTLIRRYRAETDQGRTQDDEQLDQD